MIGPANPVESPTTHVVGLALMFLAPGLLFAAAIEWGSSTSHDEWALVISAIICFVVGLVLNRATALGDDVRAVSVFSIVAWTWIVCSLFGALPYLLGSMFTWSSWDGALFESISGFSCTGSTVLDDIESHGRGVLMWRQLTQWYGGMGMVVLAVTVLPYLGVGGLALMTGLNFLGGGVLAVMEILRWDMVGYLILLSLFTWFFAVAIPVMNRAIREQVGANPRSYWGGIVEIFARIVLCAQTGLHAAILIYAALGLFQAE
jgi:Trk-type K+ transport system membrane component